MVAFIENFDDALFICLESEIKSLEKLGFDLKLYETNKFEEQLYYMNEPAYFFRLETEEDRNLLKLTHPCANIKLGDLYGFGQPIFIRQPKKASSN